MEAVWVYDRMRLYRLTQKHRDWSNQQFADALNRSLSWVKKWRRRFREASQITLATFLSQSRAPHHRPRKINQPVKQAILLLREHLGQIYHQRVGPKRILYHLRRDTDLERTGHRLPRSPTTVWRILRDGGRIVQPVRCSPMAIPRPTPMQEWEFDFGQISIGKDKLEFLPVVDRGTSVLVSLLGSGGYHAETALEAIAQILLVNGCPQSLRFDNDPRLVASWATDGFPSALERFLMCLDIEPKTCDPGSPWQKPFVERIIGTIKYEHLYPNHPENLQHGLDLLDAYPLFYNTDRPNQALTCGNRPPYTAFPTLPILPRVPEWVDPDHWLMHCHGDIFQRTVGSTGSVRVDNQSYYVGRAYAKQRLSLYIDANEKSFWVLSGSKRITVKPIKDLKGGKVTFPQFVKMMALEARSIERHRQI